MKIHYNKEFNCFETTECHKTDNIELDGAQLIPITELEKIKAEIVELEKKMGQGIFTVELASEIVNDHIAELKGETTNPKGVLEQIAEEQKTLLDTTKAWSNYIDKNGNIY